jgi:hypothetical protein
MAAMAAVGHGAEVPTPTTSCALADAAKKRKAARHTATVQIFLQFIAESPRRFLGSVGLQAKIRGEGKLPGEGASSFVCFGFRTTPIA